MKRCEGMDPRDRWPYVQRCVNEATTQRQVDGELVNVCTQHAKQIDAS